MGVLNLDNKNTLYCYSKKINTVETVTYGSDLFSTCTCVGQIIDPRNTLWYLGVNIFHKRYMFGYNKYVVDSSTHPNSKLHNTHAALSFYQVCEDIASNVVAFYHVSGEDNPDGVISNHWRYSKVWVILRPIIFLMGNTRFRVQEIL